MQHQAWFMQCWNWTQGSTHSKTALCQTSQLSSPAYWVLLFIVYCVCVGTHILAHVFKSKDNLWELVLQSTVWVSGIQRRYSGCWQVPLPAEPSCWPLHIFLNYQTCHHLSIEDQLECPQVFTFCHYTLGTAKATIFTQTYSLSLKKCVVCTIW